MSIKNDPQMKIITVITDMTQHSNEILKQQANVSEVRKNLDALSRKLAWQIATKDKIFDFVKKNPDQSKWAPEEKAKIERIEKSYLHEYEIEELIRQTVTAIDNPLRTLITVGNSLKKAAESLRSMAQAEIGKVARQELAEVMSKPLTVPGLTIESAKADPYEAQEAEERANKKEGILDLDEQPAE